MRALILPSLEIEDRPDQPPGEGEIAVRVHAAGINRADLLQRAGKYPAPPGWPADIPGLEYAGEVVATGRGVTYWTTGDRVMGLVGGGAHADRVVVHQAEAMAIPDGMAYTDAAAIPEAFLTAWDALVVQGRVRAGERVLTHTIGSGVGTAVVQLAAVLGVTLVGTSRTPDKLARARALGLEHGVLLTPPPQGGAGQGGWVRDVGAPVHVILDTLGAAHFDAHLSLLASGGRLVLVGTLTGSAAERVDLGRLLRQRLAIVGTAMRPRQARERRALVERFTGEILPHFASGTLRPVMERVMPWTEAAAGYELLASNATFGKVVLDVTGLPRDTAAG